MQKSTPGGFALARKTYVLPDVQVLNANEPTEGKPRLERKWMREKNFLNVNSMRILFLLLLYCILSS